MEKGKVFIGNFLNNLKHISPKKSIIILTALFLLAVFYYFILKDLPLPTKLASTSTPQSTLIYDRNGKLLYNIYDKKNQTFIPLSGVPKYMQEATIAIEDKNFYNHGAVDLRGIARAAFSIIFHQQIQGGSTLTQQLVKNSLLTQEQTIPRKIKEIILAFATELIYSKNQILEMYLNQVPYGGTSYGVEAAAEALFWQTRKRSGFGPKRSFGRTSPGANRIFSLWAHPERESKTG